MKASDSPASVCPSVLRLESRDGLSYVVVVDAPTRRYATFDVHLYTGHGDETATLSSVAIATPYETSSGESRFRSSAVTLKNAGSEPFIAATVRPILLGASEPCPAVNRDIPDPERVRARHSRSASIARLDDAISAEAAQAHEVVALAPMTAVTTFPCAEPFELPHTVQLARLVYPATHDDGTTLVKVAIDASGRVTGATVYRSSGNSLLDAAGVDAAEATTYSAAVDRCMPVPGAYLFRAQFAYGRRRF